MKIKIINLVVALVFFFGLIVTPAYAGTFSDNFNDGNTDKWISVPQGFGYNSLGNWRIVDGVLIQDSGPDHVKFLVNNLPLSNQSVETKVNFLDNGYAGISFWHYDIDNWITVYFYPSANFLRIIEHFDGVTRQDEYTVPFTRIGWFTMRVDANSLTGELAVYLDGEYIATSTVATTHRTGLSGLISGNGGGAFDDFSITSSSIPPTSKDQCRNNGWKTFTNPTFQNQGVCVNYLKSR